jgi:hypothetical protein
MGLEEGGLSDRSKENINISVLYDTLLNPNENSPTRIVRQIGGQVFTYD